MTSNGVAGRRPLRADYVAAHQLLSELREIARALPSGLDEIGLGQSLLQQLNGKADFDHAGLFTLTANGRLVLLTTFGGGLNWDPSVDASKWRSILDSGRGSLVTIGTAGQTAGRSTALLPLRIGDRGTGLVVIEREGAPWPARSLDTAQDVVDAGALQLDTGRLFSDIRTLATMEERHRMAREIHDGIAQDVASLGYLVDEIAAATPDSGTREQVQQLRTELSRIVSELRLSIFDLRSDVQADTGLGATLSSYVQRVGTASGMTVHLVLDESTQRLGVAAETELLRIAQEAIANARRHAQARNLWVTCRVHPPNAFLRIVDDGQGLGSPRNDSYGLEIMRERAARLGAQLTVRDRDGGGTVVETLLDGTDAFPIGADQRTGRDDGGDHSPDS